MIRKLFKSSRSTSDRPFSPRAVLRDLKMKKRFFLLLFLGKYYIFNIDNLYSSLIFSYFNLLISVTSLRASPTLFPTETNLTSRDNPKETNHSRSSSEDVDKKEVKLDKVLTHNASLQMNLKYSESEQVAHTTGPPTNLKITIHINKSSVPNEIITDNSTKLNTEQLTVDKSTQTARNETKPITQLDISPRKTENLSQPVVAMTVAPTEENKKRAATIEPANLKRQKKSTFDKNTKVSDPSLVAPGEKILEFKPQEFIYQPSSGYEAIHASKLRAKREAEDKIQQTATMQSPATTDLKHSRSPAESIFQVTQSTPQVTKSPEEEQLILKNFTSINLAAEAGNNTHKILKNAEPTEDIIKHVSSHIPAEPENRSLDREINRTMVYQTQSPKIKQVTETSLESKKENLTVKVIQTDNASGQPRLRRDQGKEKELVRESQSSNNQSPIVQLPVQAGYQKQSDKDVTVKIDTNPEEAVNATPEETSLTEDNGTMSSLDDQGVAKASHSLSDNINDQTSKDSKQTVMEPVPEASTQNRRSKREVTLKLDTVSTIKPNSEVTLIKQEMTDKTTSESYMKSLAPMRPELKQNIEVVVGATDTRSKRDVTKIPKPTTVIPLHVSFKIDGARSGPYPGNFKDLIDASKGQDTTREPLLDEQPTARPAAKKIDNKREIKEGGFTVFPTGPSKRDVIKVLKQLIDTKMVSQPDVITKNISQLNSENKESLTTLSASQNTAKESTNIPTENSNVQKEVSEESKQETRTPFNRDEIFSVTKEPPKETAATTQSEIKQEVTGASPKVEITEIGTVGIQSRVKRDEHSKIYKHSAVKSTVDLIKRALGKSIGSEQTHVKQEKISNENITVIQTVKQDGMPDLPVENTSISQIDMSEVVNASTPTSETTVTPIAARVKRNDLYKTNQNSTIKQSAIYKKLFPENLDLKMKANSSIGLSGYSVTAKVEEIDSRKETTSEKYFKNKVDSKDLFSKINHTKISNPLGLTKNNSLKKVKKDYNSKFEPSISALYGKRVRRSGNAKIPELIDSIKQKSEERSIDNKPQAEKSKNVPYALENMNITQPKDVEILKLEEPLVKPTLIPESKKIDKKIDVTKIPNISLVTLVNANFTTVESRENATFEPVSDATKSILEQKGEGHNSEILKNPQNEKRAVTIAGDVTLITRAKRQETNLGENETQHTIVDKDAVDNLVAITPRIGTTIPTMVNEKNESQNIADHEKSSERILVESSKVPPLHTATESTNSTHGLKNFLEDKVSSDSVVIITDIKNKTEEKIELKNITDVTLMLHIPENRTIKNPLTDTNLLMIDMQNMSDIERILQSAIPQANLPSLLAINLKIIRNNQIQNDRNRRDVQENPFSEMVDVGEDKLEKSFSEQEVSPTYSRFVREDSFEGGEDRSELIYDEAYHDPENPLQKEHLRKRIRRTALNNSKETTTVKNSKSHEKTPKVEGKEHEKSQETRKIGTTNHNMKVEKKTTVRPESKFEKTFPPILAHGQKQPTATPGTIAKTTKKSIKPVVKRQAYPRFFYKLSEDEAMEFAKKTEERSRFKRNPGDVFRLPDEFHHNIMVEVPVIE